MSVKDSVQSVTPGDSSATLGAAMFLLRGLRQLAWLAVLVVVGYLYIGLYSPDEFLLHREPASWYLLVALRVGVPVLGIMLGALFFAVRRGALPTAALYTVIGSLVGGGFLFVACGAIAGMLFPGNPDLSRYNSFLQLAPPLYVPRERAPGANPKMIFFLGGSTTEWKDSRGEDWPSRVEKLLNASSPGAVEAHNLGRQWYTSMHSLINYQVNLQRYKPDVVVVMHAINDVVQNADFSYYSLGGFRDDYGHFLGPLVNIVLHRNAFSSIGMRLGRLWNYPTREWVQTDTFPGLQTFKRNLATLVFLAQANGAKPVLMTQPHMLRADLSPEEEAKMTMVQNEAVGPRKRWTMATALSAMTQYNQMTRVVAEEQGALLIDLESVLPKSLAFFSDEVHYEDQAFPILAEHIARGLQEQGV